MKLRKAPYHILLLLAGLNLPLLIVSRPFYIHYSDTYFVLNSAIFYLPFAILLAALWIIYRLARRSLLSGRLTLIHTTLTSTFCSFFLLLPFFHRFFIITLYPVRFDPMGWLDFMATLFLLLLVFSQVLLIINVLGGLLTRSAGRQ